MQRALAWFLLYRVCNFNLSYIEHITCVLMCLSAEECYGLFSKNCSKVIQQYGTFVPHTWSCWFVKFIVEMSASVLNTGKCWQGNKTFKAIQIFQRCMDGAFLKKVHLNTSATVTRVRTELNWYAVSVCQIIYCLATFRSITSNTTFMKERAQMLQYIHVRLPVV